MSATTKTTLAVLPLRNKGTPFDLEALANRLGHCDLRAIKAAQNAGALYFGASPTIAEKTFFWAITDATGRAAAVRLLTGSPFLDSSVWQGGNLGDTGWPIGAKDIGDSRVVGLVQGAESTVGAYQFWTEDGSIARGLKIVTMIDNSPIATDALQYFVGREIVMGDMSELPKWGGELAAEAYGNWRKQLIPIAKSVTNVPSGGESWRLATGQYVADFAELATLGSQNARAEKLKRENARRKLLELGLDGFGLEQLLGL